jgi:hypothetical protein
VATYTQDGNLSALPADAVPFGAERTHTLLRGKYYDTDGIVYDADGTVREDLTALMAREIAAHRTAAPYAQYTPPSEELLRDSIREQSESDATRTEVNMTIDNVLSTIAEIPARLVEAVQDSAKILLIVGVGWIALQVLQDAPRIRTVKRRMKQARKRAAKYIAG